MENYADKAIIINLDWHVNHYFLLSEMANVLYFTVQTNI